MIAKGLGSTWKVDSSGDWVDCDLWGNMTNGACWNPWNPQVTGPNATKPLTPSNPITDVVLGANTPPGQSPFSITDYLGSYADPSNIAWLGILIVGGIVVLKGI